jgi:hypothetical protein
MDASYDRAFAREGFKKMTRRQLMGSGFVLAAALAVGATTGGCAGMVQTDTVQVIVIAKARDGETVADLKVRAFANVEFTSIPNTTAKVGWVVYNGQIEADIVVTNREIEVDQIDFVTSEGDVAEDVTNYATERPEAEQLAGGEQIAFFLLDCESVAVAEGGESYAALLGDDDFDQIVVLRGGKVVEEIDLVSGVAEAGDELVHFPPGKITA